MALPVRAVGAFLDKSVSSVPSPRSLFVSHK